MQVVLNIVLFHNRRITRQMGTPVFFQNEYAWNNNCGRAVGIDTDSVLVLERNAERDGWLNQPVHFAEVREIRAKQYRSIYILALAAGSAAIAILVAYIGIAGDASGFGIFTIPLFLGVFSYLAFTGSKRIRIDFDALSKRLVYKSWPGSLKETMAAIPKLQQWANEHSIQMEVQFAIHTEDEIGPGDETEPPTRFG